MYSKVSKSSKPQKLDKEVEFVYYAPMASKVFLVGSFNRWDSSKTPLKKDRAGNWKIKLTLGPGRHEYRYLVDDTWQNDQRPLECVPNAFGTWNCIITLS